MIGSVRAVLDGAIDYAGLFPPAALAMPDAVARFARHRGGPDAWALGRFVVPAARLPELGVCARPLASGDRWRVSALVGDDLAGDIACVRAFNAQHATGAAGWAEVDAVEWRPAAAAAIAADPAALPRGMVAYAEVALGEHLPAMVAAARAVGVRAKVRTGGTTAAAFPTAERLAGFIAACTAAAVPFKATAGLHHALRGEYALTYAPDSDRAPMFGYLNVLLAAAFARAGATAPVLAELLLVSRAQDVEFTTRGVRWCGHLVSIAQLHAARAEGMVSFGSCSFTEPLADLSTHSLA